MKFHYIIIVFAIAAPLTFFSYVLVDQRLAILIQELIMLHEVLRKVASNIPDLFPGELRNEGAVLILSKVGRAPHALEFVRPLFQCVELNRDFSRRTFPWRAADPLP
jgi:hypothetical protein